MNGVEARAASVSERIRSKLIVVRSLTLAALPSTPFTVYSRTMFSIGTCPVCQTGPLGLRCCGVCRRVVSLCDECDVAWPGPAEGRPATTGGETMPCPGCGADLWSEGAHWATRDDLKGAEWVTRSGAKLEEGASIDPGP